MQFAPVTERSETARHRFVGPHLHKSALNLIEIVFNALGQDSEIFEN